MPLISLKQWTERVLTDLFTAPLQSPTTEYPITLEQHFELVIAEEAEIRVNGQSLSRGELRTLLADMREQWTIENITFIRTLEHLEDVSRGAQAGEVGTMFDAHGHYNQNRRFAAEIRICANVTIAWQSVGDDDDRRKISAMTMVYVEVPATKE
ncbi:hypothetical protein EXIGLDRAFT_725681 [Exidia glandulosa HHB12029]|uniref:Uncharacterized protein n=1 Tax=Exidia glandulosa HHB12029 TaxID=1314781 RepID=A0A165Q833_EXIGL|nr:hypothetical protein EXIGLDRAFT_725681 [Exidia glandulosa HHB12029]